MQIMALAMVNGLITSIFLETVILKLQGMTLSQSFKTAMGMSLISMIAMARDEYGGFYLVRGHSPNKIILFTAYSIFRIHNTFTL